MRTGALLLVALASACSMQRADSTVESASSRQGQLVSGDLVIADVYGGGGVSGAAFTHDFVVLFNRGAASATVSGLRLTYGSDTGNFATGGSSTVDLPDDDIPAGGSYLVRLATGGNSGAAVPAYDATGSINMSAGAGKIALTTVTGGLGSCGSASTQCDPAKWIDMLGWGSSVTQSEGAHGGNTVASTGLSRAALGCTDSGDNGSDFVVGTPTTPRSSTTSATPCAGLDLGPPDLAPPPDMATATDLAGADLSGSSAILLNEVKWNPFGADNGQEFVELLGSGTIPQRTYLLSVEGDASSTPGRINYVRNLGGVSFGSNGLLLVKSTATTLAGVAAATTIIDDSLFNGAPLQNGSESILVVSAAAPLTIVVGTTNLSSLMGLTILDGIAAKALAGDTTYGSATFAACPAVGASAVDGASRITGDLRANTLAAWVAGQAISSADSQGLVSVAECSGGPASFAQSPGRANDDPFTSAPDLAPPADLTVVHDLAQAADLGAQDLAGHDLAGADLASALPEDASVVEDAGQGASDLARPRNVRDQGCSTTPGQRTELPVVLLVAAGMLVLARRRGTRSF